MIARKESQMEIGGPKYPKPETYAAGHAFSLVLMINNFFCHFTSPSTSSVILEQLSKSNTGPRCSLFPGTLINSFGHPYINMMSIL